MTAERIAEIQHYAYKIYWEHREEVFFIGDTLEDFQQSFLLMVLENPDLPLRKVYGKMVFRRMKVADEVPYAVENMTPFTALIPSGMEYDSDYLERLFGASEDCFQCASERMIARLVMLICPGAKRQERRAELLDFAYGMSVGSCGSKNRKIRQLLFNHRFEVLDFFVLNGVILPREYVRLRKIAKEIETLPKVKRELSQSYSARDCRERYHRDIEKSRERVRSAAIKRKEGQKAQENKGGNNGRGHTKN